MPVVAVPAMMPRAPIRSIVDVVSGTSMGRALRPPETTAAVSARIAIVCEPRLMVSGALGRQHLVRSGKLGAGTEHESCAEQQDCRDAHVRLHLHAALAAEGSDGHEIVFHRVAIGIMAGTCRLAAAANFFRQKSPVGPSKSLSRHDGAALNAYDQIGGTP